MPALADTRPDLASLDPILAAALAKKADDRFACCTDFARAFTETTAPQTPRVAAAPTTPAPAARRLHVTPTPTKTVGANAQSDSAGSVTRRLIGVSVVAVLLLLVAIGLLWRPWQHPQSNTTAISSSNAPTTSTPTRTMTAAAPSPVAPPPVTVTAPTTSTAQVQTGPTIGDECDDWMKFSTDPLSGQEMLCSGYPDNLSRGEPMKWYSAEAGAVGPSSGWADAPRVGKTGSSCSGEVPYTMGRSSDGYGVWCVGDGAQADKNPVWAAYHP